MVETARIYRQFDFTAEAHGAAPEYFPTALSVVGMPIAPVCTELRFDSLISWNSWAQRHIGEVSTAISSIPFSLRLSFAIGTGLGVAQLTGNAERFNSACIRDGKLPCIALIMQSGAPRFMSQGDRSGRIGNHDLALLDLRRPFECHGPHTTSSQLVFLLDAGQVESVIPNVSDHLCTRIQTRNGWGARLFAYLQGLTPKTLAQLAENNIRHSQILPEHILELLRNALHESARMPDVEFLSERRKTVDERRDLKLRRHVVKWLEDNYHDESLNQAKVAKAFKISISRLHQAFSSNDDGLSFLHTLHRIRVENAARILTDEHSHGLRVAEAGILCGIPNASTFYRIFSKAFGVTPRQYKKQFRQPDGRHSATGA